MLEIKTQVEDMIDKKLGNLGTKKNNPATKHSIGSNIDRAGRTPNHLCGTIEETRDLNLIIHGIEEESNGVEEGFVKKLFRIVEMDHTGPTIAHSLGSKK